MVYLSWNLCAHYTGIIQAVWRIQIQGFKSMYYSVYVHVTWYQQLWEQKIMSQALHYNTIGLKTLRFWVFKKATTTTNQKYPQQNKTGLWALFCYNCKSEQKLLKFACLPPFGTWAGEGTQTSWCILCCKYRFALTVQTDCFLWWT